MAVTTARLAFLDPAAQAPPCLVGEILKKQGVHRTLEPDMQMGDLAFRQRDYLHITIGHALEQAGNVLLIAR